MTPTTTSPCPRCGGAVLSSDRFCGSCGSRLASVVSANTGPASLGSVRSTTGSEPNTAAPPSAWDAIARRLQLATLGEFEIMTELGRGGMAAVFLARDLALNRRVAIKVMAPGLLIGPGMLERFRQEAITVANLQHAHIVAIHGVRQIEDLHFFVMQFVPGRTLEGVLRDHGALPTSVARAWLHQVGSALGYAHRRGVIHRDIKPGNILLNTDGEAIVTDFGIAKVAEGPSHTQTGAVVGTPLYMSPEQCYARQLTGASDQYSLGVVAYEMIAGKPPFAGLSFALMRAHTDASPPPIRDTRPDVPPTMEAAVLRMLAKKPDDRFATIADALIALGAGPLMPDDPLHATLQQLAAATERLELLGDAIRTPASPVPMTRERPKPGAASAAASSDQPAVVAIDPPPSDLEPGSIALLRAVVKTAAGQRVSDAAIVWTSSAPSIVAIDAGTGSLKAIAKGSAAVSAVVGQARTTVDVVIDAPRAAHITISIPAGALPAGHSVLVAAMVKSRFGVRVARPIEWSVTDPSTAIIERSATNAGSPAAMVRGVSSGTTTIVAVCGDVTASATLTVVPAPPVG
jgi:serine/threonine protein kinase